MRGAGGWPTGRSSGRYRSISLFSRARSIASRSCAAATRSRSTQSRGRHLLDQITGLLRSYGYAVAETTHDCGRLGGLAQSRKRILLVARHHQKVPPFLYEPPNRPLRAVGDVLGRMPMPGDIHRAGPMHRLPALQWQTWVRLAFVEAGSDWRSLSRLNVVDGQLTDFRIAPDEPWRNGALGVTPWAEPTGTVTANGRPAAGSFSVADPRRAEGVAAFGRMRGTFSKISREPTGRTVGAVVADPRSYDQQIAMMDGLEHGWSPRESGEIRERPARSARKARQWPDVARRRSGRPGRRR